MQLAVGHGNVGIGRRHVNSVRLGRQVVARLRHSQRGFTRQQFDHETAVIGRHVLRHDIGHVGMGRQTGNEGAKRLEPASRGTDADVIQWRIG